jgi:dGTP triphosphohydrolase
MNSTQEFPELGWMTAGLLGLALASYMAKDWRHRSCACHRAGYDGSVAHPDITLQPVMNPLFNLREICKQSLLLEDHLAQPSKRCNDCINKHFLTIEALAEEAVSLDRGGDHKRLLLSIAPEVRKLHRAVLAKDDMHHTAQRLRLLRKRLVPHCANQFRDL